MDDVVLALEGFKKVVQLSELGGMPPVAITTLWAVSVEIGEDALDLLGREFLWMKGFWVVLRILGLCLIADVEADER